MPSETFTVVLSCADLEPVQFTARADRSIVKSAASAGYNLTTGCLQGRCAICRARLRSGEVAALRKLSKHALTDPARRADGCVLLCSVGPRSDLVLEVLSAWTERTTKPALTLSERGSGDPAPPLDRGQQPT